MMMRLFVQALRCNLQELEIPVLSTQTGAGAPGLARQVSDRRGRLGVLRCRTALGLGVLRHIRGHDTTVPVILMLAEGGTANAAIEAIACGAFDYVYKPVRPEDHARPWLFRR